MIDEKKLMEETRSQLFKSELLGSRWFAINDMLELIKRQPKVGEWIPCSERLPEVGEYILGTNEYDEVLIYYYAWNSPHTKKKFFHLCGAATTIKAWMPLPEPWEGEDDV